MNTIVDLRTTLKCVQGNNPRSISFMIQTTTSSDSRIIYTGSLVNFGNFGIFINNLGIINVDIYSVWYSPSTGKAINDGLWHTVLVTYDGTTLFIYVDGVFDNTATNWNVATTATIASTLNTIGNSGNYLGQWADGISYKWIGQLKNVIFYDYVITNSYALANSYQLAGSILYNSGTISTITICYYVIIIYIKAIL